MKKLYWFNYSVVATLILTVVIGNPIPNASAQDSSQSIPNSNSQSNSDSQIKNSNQSTSVYSLSGMSLSPLNGGYLQISGSFTANDSNNDKLIDKSEILDFKLSLKDKSTTISCNLPALTKFQLDDSQGYLDRFRKIGSAVPASVLNLKLSCQSKNVEFSLLGNQLRGKIKSNSNFSESEQNSNATGIGISFSTGISWGTTEFETSVYQLNIVSTSNNHTEKRPLTRQEYQELLTDFIRSHFHNPITEVR